MNLRQGKIGGQEALCITAIAACASSIFTPDSQALYAQGNSAYVSMLLSAAAAICVFLLASRAMRASNAEGLWDLLRRGLGPVVGHIAGVLIAGMLVLLAAMALNRFLLMLASFVFPQAAAWQMLLFLLAAAAVPAWVGLEGLGRAGKLLCWLLLASLLLALLLAGSNYELYRLAPYLGDGTLNLLDTSARGISLFLPALLGLLVAANGVHGTSAARRAGLRAGILSGALASASQFCLGMLYSYHDLAAMHSPMFRLTMGYKTGSAFPRLDLLLFFGWAIGGMLGAAFYIYIASLLFAQVFQLEDVRPSVAVCAGCTGALALLLHLQIPALAWLITFVAQYGYLLLMSPVLLAAAIAPAAARRRLLPDSKGGRV